MTMTEVRNVVEKKGKTREEIEIKKRKNERRRWTGLKKTELEGRK